METYKIGFWRVLKTNLYPLFLLFISLVTLGYSFLLILASNKSYTSLTIFSIFWVSFIVIPTTVLNINYWKEDKNKKVFFDDQKEKITISKNEKTVQLSYAEIIRIYKCGLQNREDRMLSNSPWTSFYYYKIELKTNECIYLTRFTIEKIEKKFRKLKTEHHPQRFPMISTLIDK